MANHDRKRKEVLSHLRERGLTLNRAKCEFRLPQMTFMGKSYPCTEWGQLRQRSRAVSKARELENASEVRSFLGLVNFNARFIPGLATTAEPLIIKASLSLLTMKSKTQADRNVSGEYVRLVAESAAPWPIPIQKIERESANDPHLEEERHCIQTNS